MSGYTFPEEEEQNAHLASCPSENTSNQVTHCSLIEILKRTVRRPFQHSQKDTVKPSHSIPHTTSGIYSCHRQFSTNTHYRIDTAHPNTASQQTRYSTYYLLEKSNQIRKRIFPLCLRITVRPRLRRLRLRSSSLRLQSWLGR